jgi:PAS domain S-box-containing protein
MDSKQLTLLTIDDEDSLRRTIKIYFEDIGFNVLEAGNGRLGLEMFRQHHPDIVLVDLRMPEMDGRDVIRFLAGEAPEIPVVVVSGTGLLEDAVEAIRDGAWDYVTKPIHDMLALEHVVNRVLERARLLTENRNYQQRLEELVEERTREIARLATALEQSAEEIVITNPEGIIEYVNPAFEKIMGYCRADIIGSPLAIQNNGKHDPELAKTLWNTVKQGLVWRGRLESKTSRKDVIVEEATVSPIVDSHANTVGYVCIKRDVTKQLELEAMLRQAQKMEAIGTLAGGIAHDFNNILSGIYGFTEIAMFDLEQDTSLYKNLLEVVKAADRARQLIQQILTFSRQREFKTKPIHNKYIAKEVIKLIKASFPDSIVIKENIVSESLVMGDPSQIHQVIMNLCTNAGHAMEKTGGTLTISLEDVRIDEDFAAGIPDAVPGCYQRLKIADTGCGMRNEVLEHIFEPFFTTKGEGEGTGLGLSVVHGIIKKFKGFILVDSIPGRGTAFQVYLPVTDENIKEKERRPTIKSSGTEKILFIDDEDIVVQVVKEMLSINGYQVHAFTDSREALELFRQDFDSFDLIITDLSMPHLSGSLLIKKIKEIRADIPVVVCTGYQGRLSEIECRELNITKTITKPLVMNEFIGQIREILDASRC